MENRNSKAEEIIGRLSAKGVKLWTEEDKIKFRAANGILKKEDMAELKEYKQEIIDVLNGMKGRIRIIEDPEHRFEPFLLTDVQQSYLMGRKNLFDYGGVACHIYLQLDYEHIDVKRAEDIWNRLIVHHEMLRTVIHEEGYQQIMEKAPHFTVTDYGSTDRNEVMKKMGHSSYKVGSWPYFSVGVTNYENSAVMHFSIEFIIADWTSIWLLLLQFEGLYFGTISELPEISVSFRDYVIAERELKAGAAYENDRKYWLDKIETFPECPHIDTKKYDPDSKAEFERRFLQFTPEQWAKIKKAAVNCSVTPTALMLTAYASVLERYSENKRFAINLTILGRQDCHRDIGKVVGDFTSLNMLEVDFENTSDFTSTAQKASRELFEDLDHSLYSGVSFMREVSRRKGADAAFMPYVFTSAIGLLNSMNAQSLKGMVTGTGISQTPQVFIDCQVMDGDFGMQVNWDVRKNVFDEKMLDDMFMLFSEILMKIAEDESAEHAVRYDYPAYQEELYRKANDTDCKLPEHLLHSEVISSAEKYPDKTAVIAGAEKYSYADLMKIAGRICSALDKNGVKQGDRVGIAAKKSVYQPAGAIAVLAAGAVYVPVSVEQGANRIKKIIDKADIKYIITLKGDTTDYPDGISVIYADELNEEGMLPDTEKASAEDLAYIIFTSGSTGEPKGVAVSHQAAVNTIEDINRRYAVGPDDSVLGVSQLTFDLSVYDIFGLLSVGGMLVYPEDSRKKEPQYLAELLSVNKVTVWNSVPSLLNMITVYLDHESEIPDISSLRLVMLSGDWIPLGLPDKLHEYSANAQVVSLGGATEAAIWSIYHDYNGLSEGFASIPYGYPLANQQFCILDSKKRTCPVGVKGDIYILGKGLAEGYYNDTEKTEKQFIKHPVSGERMYMTGDVGKYHYNGEIEFLGRSDSQIKLNGHRIELGEIESAVNHVNSVEAASVIYLSSENEHAVVCCYEPAFSDDSAQNEYKNEFEKFTYRIDTEAEKVFENTDIKRVIAAFDIQNELLYSGMANALYEVSGNKKSFVLNDLFSSGKILEKYQWLVEYWLKDLVKQNILRSDGDTFEFTDKFIPVDKESYRSEWDDLISKEGNISNSAAFMRYIRNSATELNGLLSGDTDPVKLLYPDGSTDVVTDMYVNNLMSQYLNRCICSFTANYAKNNKKVRILEIGAGTCATSLQVTKALEGMDYTYYVTDINPHFIPLAEGKFEGNPNMRFSVLNIDRDISEQGFEENSFDIIIAVGVLENAEDIRYSAAQIRRLARPGGYFLFTEPFREEAWILASQGFLMTKPQDDIRKDKAFIDSQMWQSIFNENDPDSSLSVLPEPGSSLETYGMELFVKQMKTDRVNISGEEISSVIRDNLASYMIPSVYIMLDHMPVTANGKTDEKALRSIAEKRVTSSAADKTDGNDSVMSGMTDLQRSVAEILGSFGLKGLGLHDSFYDHGADSLIMAQITGKIRETMINDVPFDSILRFMLNNPDIYNVAEFIQSVKNGEHEAEESRRKENGHIGNAEIISAGEGPLRVVFHAGFGTVNILRGLVNELIAQNAGDVMTIALGDTEKFFSMDEKEIIPALADDYSALIEETGAEHVQLIGYSFGGWLASQCAVRLAEKGIEIDDVLLIDSQTVPWLIEDRIFLEMMFIQNYGLTFGNLEMMKECVNCDIEDMFKYLIDTDGKIEEKCYEKLRSDSRFETLCSGMEKLAATDKDERFRMYAAAAAEKTSESIIPSVLESMFDFYCRILRSYSCEMDTYFGDIRYVRPEGNSKMFYEFEKDRSFWSSICIGEMEVIDVAGDHYTCIEMPESIAKIAETAKIIKS